MSCFHIYPHPLKVKSLCFANSTFCLLFFQKHQFKKFTEFFNEDYSPVEQIEDMKEKLLEVLSKEQNISRLSKINWRNH